MKPTRLLLTATALALLSACAPQRKPPPVVVAPPPPRPTPPPPPADWRDAPQSPGTWHYVGGYAGGSALYGAAGADPLFGLTCERAASRVVVRRAGAAAGQVPLSIATTTGTRVFTAAPEAGPPPAVTLALPVRDPVLDAMAFSRGRFMVEVPGLPPLYLPAWPELARAIEDCR